MCAVATTIASLVPLPAPARMSFSPISDTQQAQFAFCWQSQRAILGATLGMNRAGGVLRFTHCLSHAKLATDLLIVLIDGP